MYLRSIIHLPQFWNPSIVRASSPVTQHQSKASLTHKGSTNPALEASVDRRERLHCNISKEPPLANTYFPEVPAWIEKYVLWDSGCLSFRPRCAFHDQLLRVSILKFSGRFQPDSESSSYLVPASPATVCPLLGAQGLSLGSLHWTVSFSRGYAIPGMVSAGEEDKVLIQE